MTKPMNFPERKNRRRKAVLERWYSMHPETSANVPVEMQTLVMRTAPDLREVRTKKIRPKNWKQLRKKRRVN